jgi:hypothetical protein
MGPVTIGVDVGKQRDPTAIAVVEVESREIIEPAAEPPPWWQPPPPRPQTEPHYNVRHLERLPLGTPYPAVAERVAAVVDGVIERIDAAAPCRPPRSRLDQLLADGARLPRLFVDATGMGTPLVDIFRAKRVRATIIATYFTHGTQWNVVNGELRLGKARLVSELQVLLQTRRVHLPQTAEAQALAQELRDFEIRVSEDADEKYGAFKTGAHDDLVTAIGLAMQPAMPTTRCGVPSLAWAVVKTPPGPRDRRRWRPS